MLAGISASTMPVRQGVTFLLLATVAQAYTAQNSSDLKSIQSVGAFMQTYYLHPQPDRIADVIDALNPTGFVRPSTEFVLIGFFSEVFAANPKRVSEWQDHIAKQNAPAKAILERALSVSKTGGLLNENGHSPQLNDGWWAAFFASGNAKFIDKIIDQLQYCDERNDESLFFAGATAKLSLASNARTNPAVLLALNAAKANATGRTQDLANEALNEDPGNIKQEIKEIIQSQRQTGKWK